MVKNRPHSGLEYRDALRRLRPVFKLLIAAGIGCGLSACAADATGSQADSLIGSWVLEYIEGQAVLEDTEASFEFRSDGQVAGNASCNRFTGGYEIVDGKLRIGKLAVTSMMCLDDAMEQEGRFLKAIQLAEFWKVEDGSLVLIDVADAPLLKASAVTGDDAG